MNGRGIVVSPDIQKPMMTENCIVVCCRKLAVHLMNYSDEYAARQTRG